MEYTVYERPREKLQSRGARALSTPELLQIIISSGTRTVSGARIAKEVAILLDHTPAPTYTQFIGIRGLGVAKVSQLLAALELGRRRERLRLVPHTADSSFAALAAASKRTIEFSTIRGDGVAVSRGIMPAHGDLEALVSVRKVFAQALHDEAYTVSIGLGCRNQTITILDDTMLAVLKKVFETAELLEIKVPAVWIVNKKTKQAFRRKALL